MQKPVLWAVLAALLVASGAPSFAQEKETFSPEQYIFMDLRRTNANNERNVGLAEGRFATLPDAYRQALLGRLINYVQVDSQSQEDDSVEFPMNDNLRATAGLLFEELKMIVGSDKNFSLHLSSDQYIYVNVASNLNRPAPILGFSAHYDSTPEIEGTSIKPQVFQNYNGGDIVVNQEKGLIINPENNPYLAKLKGKTIITSDGTTMLSGDDKAGVSILMTLIETLAENPNFKHGPLQFVITPNEDIGMSANKLDLKYYKPDFAFDFDGGVDGEVIVENFTAELYTLTMEGRDAHPYNAKECDMLDPNQPGACFVAGLPEQLWPQNSEKREPYCHVYSMEKRGNKMVLKCRVRYFDRADGAEIDRIINEQADAVEKAFRIEVQRHKEMQYENVKYGVNPQAEQLIVKAAQDAGVTPRLVAERAGTTTAMMMAKWGFGGYTLFTGQVNPHSYTEWVSEDDMFKSYKTGLNLIKEVSQLKANAVK